MCFCEILVSNILMTIIVFWKLREILKCFNKWCLFTSLSSWKSQKNWEFSINFFQISLNVYVKDFRFVSLVFIIQEVLTSLTSISWNVALLIILVHDVISLLYYQHWTGKRKHFYVFGPNRPFCPRNGMSSYLWILSKDFFELFRLARPPKNPKKSKKLELLKNPRKS